MVCAAIPSGEINFEVCVYVPDARRLTVSRAVGESYPFKVGHFSNAKKGTKQKREGAFWLPGVLSGTDHPMQF